MILSGAIMRSLIVLSKLNGMPSGLLSELGQRCSASATMVSEQLNCKRGDAESASAALFVLAMLWLEKFDAND